MARWVIVLVLAAAGVAAAADEVTKVPTLRHYVAPEYPAGERGEAVVIVQLDVDEHGVVTAVAIAESGGPGFDAAALAAARELAFEPAEVDGVAVPVRITFRFAFTLHEEPAAPVVNFEGIVRERFGKQPLAGVHVTLPDLAIAADTDASGAFAFADVPPGTHRVELSGATLVTVTTEEELTAGHKRTVTYYLEERLDEDVDEEVVVRAARVRKESTEVVIRAAEARLVPGTQGDTLKVVHNLPGVGRAAIGSGQLVVWGGAPRDTRVFIDGVELPALYHHGGIRAVVSSDLVGDIQLVPGAYAADHGRGLGGLVRIETRPLPADGTHGHVAADFLDASALVSVAASERLRVAAAARYSYLDRLLAGVLAPDIGDFFPLPRYADAQLKLTYAPASGEELSAVVLGSLDALDRTVPAADPTEVRTASLESQFVRGYLRYSRVLAGGDSFVLTPFVGYDTATETTAFGSVPTELELDTWRWGLRASYRVRAAEEATLALGLDVLGSSSGVFRFGSLSRPAREGDVVVFGQAPGDEVAADDWSVHVVDAAPHVTAEWRLGAFTFEPGLRLDGWVLGASRLTPRVGATPAIGTTRILWTLEPRASAHWQVTPELRLSVAAGLFHQAPEPEELSAVFGTPTLALAEAAHLALTTSAEVTEGVTLEVVGFYKSLDHLVARSASPTPLLAQALTQDGSGESYGAQVLLRQRLSEGLFGWLAYAASRSTRSDPGTGERLFDYDQTHVLSLVASWAVDDWTFGARLRWATGFPRTPVVDAFYDARGDRWQPLFGEHNASRIPDFVQLDARVERRFGLSGAELVVYADVQNLTARANPEEVAYNFDYSQREYITGLPLLAVLGARLEL